MTLIATALAIEPEAVAPLLQIARAKAERVARAVADDATRPPGYRPSGRS